MPGERAIDRSSRMEEMMGLEILSAGPMTTIQDLGRQGFGDKGYRRCGACDKYAMRLANLLAWNLAKGDNSPVLEFTLSGGKIRFLENCLFALTGGDMEPKLDGRTIPMYRTVLARAGEVLEMGIAKSGLRTYLAVNGGIDVPKVMGSCSTDTVCKIGGLGGNALKVGDRLKIGAESQPWSEKKETEKAFVSLKESGAEFVLTKDLFWVKNASFRYRSMGQDLIPVLRTVPGPQEDAFTEEAMDVFRRSIYRVGMDSNRMACRLNGPILEAKHGYDIVSDGIVEGSVQVSANGQPMVMLADHQTTGGYAKIGTVVSSDLSAIAQRKPGEAIGFCFVSPKEAIEAYRLEEKKLGWLREKILVHLKKNTACKEADFFRETERKIADDFNRFEL